MGVCVWDTLYLGQIYTPLVLACIIAWLRLEKGDHLVAGIMIGLLISMKPKFCGLPVLLFLAGHRTPSVERRRDCNGRRHSRGPFGHLRAWNLSRLAAFGRN
ncbi:DUF2029 domain-containing protein [Rhizobium leguminosarum]|nr:DUF2029 domain-containing protein [Rhizobium leguminosarum]